MSTLQMLKKWLSNLKYKELQTQLKKTNNCWIKVRILIWILYFEVIHNPSLCISYTLFHWLREEVEVLLQDRKVIEEFCENDYYVIVKRKVCIRDDWI